jgi:uncharacterized protein YqjF (DUF2071 family)
MAQTFLTAEWRKLIMANYLVAPDLLAPYIPNGTELDLFNGQCFVSLIGFMFQRTRLKGIYVPMHVNFPEVNLRFYVRHGDKDGVVKRGVVFIRELVPRAALTFVANTFYGENYATVPMRHKWQERNTGLIIAYRWEKNGWQKLQVTTSAMQQPIIAGSEEEFITEHYWGYAKQRNGRTTEYEVVHPKWNIYPVLRHDIAVDFSRTYGPEFAHLTGAAPQSIFLAEGSEVTVRSGAKIVLP